MYKKRKKIIFGIIAFIGLAAAGPIYGMATIVYGHYVTAHYPMLVFELPVSECADFEENGEILVNVVSHFEKKGIKRYKPHSGYAYFTYKRRTGRVLGVRGYKIVRIDVDNIDMKKADENMVYFYIYNERFHNLLMD